MKLNSNFLQLQNAFSQIQTKENNYMPRNLRQKTYRKYSTTKVYINLYQIDIADNYLWTCFSL